jgi:hypothetical protein
MNNVLRIGVIEIRFTVDAVGIATGRSGKSIATSSLPVSELARVPY